ncbi:hypothetical protein H206_00518 [Candidatus Electrothrix aarhusensis]|jgi:hypothetical protein|uniref:Uncharacterized protein n=1 Tax=Candidatus Electrothrix aarhusensis TaxID=1859131 RepID=A0A3S3R9J0_9BACT|nr:hypothetical protein H206_00518 [Candidatus Electrothrix aarhusensis]
MALLPLVLGGYAIIMLVFLSRILYMISVLMNCGVGCIQYCKPQADLQAALGLRNRNPLFKKWFRKETA